MYLPLVDAVSRMCEYLLGTVSFFTLTIAGALCKSYTYLEIAMGAGLKNTSAFDGYSVLWSWYLSLNI